MKPLWSQCLRSWRSFISGRSWKSQTSDELRGEYPRGLHYVKDGQRAIELAQGVVDSTLTTIKSNRKFFLLKTILKKITIFTSLTFSPVIFLPP